MSVPVPVPVNYNRAVVASAQAIAVHVVSQRLLPGHTNNKISVGTAYVDIPNSMKRERQVANPVVYEPISERYYPDPVGRIFTNATHTVQAYRESVSIDLKPRKRGKIKKR